MGIMTNAGSIRPSQLITNFGPGSIVNMEHDTVMVLGLQFWPIGDDQHLFRKINHLYLARQLGKSHFKVPVSDDASAIPCVSFPTWGICQVCHRLQKHWGKPEKSSGGFPCRMCGAEQPLFHAPFVQICNNGHMHEFPWERWAHLNQVLEDGTENLCTKQDGQQPSLEYITDKKGTGLTNYVVRCLHCGASRSMSGATSTKNFTRLGFKRCNGGEPWLGSDNRKRCAENVYGIQVNSASLYYPHTVTSLLIPDWIHDVDEALDADECKGDMMVRTAREAGKSYEQILEWHKNDIFKSVLENPANTSEVVITRLKLRYDDPCRDISTEGKALEQEFDNFARITSRVVRGPPHDRKVEIEPIRIESSSLGRFYIGGLMKFHRLVSVHVLRGFTRGSPWDPYATEEQINARDQFCRIYRSKTDEATGKPITIDWLPAVEARGEGLFFMFDEDKLQRWEERPRVKERFDVMTNSYAENIVSQNRSEKESVLERFSAPRYILLHTFAHLLIREIAYHVGYSEASLRERIYSTSGKNPRNGILVYTSSSSSDGSLGGLVRLGDADIFEGIIQNTIKRSNSCSRDPLCGETDPVTMRGRAPSGMRLSGSSCYSCTLLPETSCQNHNNLLDRWVIRDPKDGFFRDLVDM